MIRRRLNDPDTRALQELVIRNGLPAVVTEVLLLLGTWSRTRKEYRAASRRAKGLLDALGVPAWTMKDRSQVRKDPHAVAMGRLGGASRSPKKMAAATLNATRWRKKSLDRTDPMG